MEMRRAALQVKTSIKQVKTSIKPKTWKKWVLYPLPSKNPNSVIRDNDDAIKVSN